jgi:hypothetical protein
VISIRITPSDPDRAPAYTPHASYNTLEPRGVAESAYGGGVHDRRGIMRKHLLTAAILAVVGSPLAQAGVIPECGGVPEPCSEFQILESMNAILTRACDVIHPTHLPTPAVCEAEYLSGDILVGRSYIRGNDGTWHKETAKERAAAAKVLRNCLEDAQPHEACIE